MSEQRMLRRLRNPDERKLVKQLLDQGWTLEATRGGHCKVTHPAGGFVVLSSSPSDHRSWLNLRSDVRRVERRVAEF